MMVLKNAAVAVSVSFFLYSCSGSRHSAADSEKPASENLQTISLNQIKFSGDTSKIGMVHIPGGEFMMGGDNDQAADDEYPKHKVIVGSFWMDEHEVTNAQFARFVEETGYVTTAERKPDWEELKKQLPPGTPKPDESQLVPASLVFTPPAHKVELSDYSQWWSWVPGADWKHPVGPQSNIKG